MTQLAPQALVYKMKHIGSILEEPTKTPQAGSFVDIKVGMSENDPSQKCKCK